MNYVPAADKTKRYVKDWGAGRPVILTHGRPVSADRWDDQAMAIADAGHHATSHDRRGFGRSPQPWTGYDHDTLVDARSCLFQRLDAGQPRGHPIDSDAD